jgi:hypothetical protein
MKILACLFFISTLAYAQTYNWPGSSTTVSGTVNVGNFPATFPATQSGAWSTGRTWNLSSLTDSVSVSNFPSSLSVTQGTSPWVVSGTVNAAQSGTWNINNIAGTVSLPTGAATSANQTNGNQKTQLVDGSGTVDGPFQTISGTNYAPVVLASSATPGSAVVARSIQIAGSDGTNAQTISTTTAGRVNVTLPTWTYKTVTGAGTNTIKSGAGTLHAFCQNSTSGNTTIYDNTAGSGNIIVAPSNTFCGTIDAAFSTGLTIVTTNAANSVSVYYQ